MGCCNISGGKYTTYRLMSEELVDILLGEIAPGRDFPCRTATTPLDIVTPPKEPMARVRMAVEREFARRLPDLLQVSTYWGHERLASREWIELLAREMGALLGWSEARVQKEIAGMGSTHRQIVSCHW